MVFSLGGAGGKAWDLVEESWPKARATSCQVRPDPSSADSAVASDIGLRV